MKNNGQILFHTVFLFFVLSLFQNCGGSNFNVDDYTNQSSTSGLSVPLTPPNIINKSADLALAVGQSAAFTATVSGSQPLTFKWYKDGQLISSAVAAELLISDLQTINAGTYALTVENGAGSTSTTFQLSVMPTPPPPPAGTAPTISTPPLDYLYRLNSQTIQLQVVASGTNLVYQWFYAPVGSGTASAIIGANQSIYIRTNAMPSHSGTYTVTVSNEFGSVSASSIVEVDPEYPLRPGDRDLRKIDSGY